MRDKPFMTKPLTETQNKIFKFITRFIAEKKKPPTLREIAKQMKYASTNAVSDVLNVLEEKGYIRRQAGARSIEILVEDDATRFGFGSPSLDRVSLVPLMETDGVAPSRMRTRGEGLYIDKNLTGGKACLFAFAGDDGMDKAGILKGDLVLVEQRPIPEVEKGCTVVAVAGDEFIVRTYQMLNGRAHLLAANASYSEKVFKPDAKESGVSIVGVVRLVIRRVLMA